MLYPTELLRLISKIFNFSPSTDSNELPLRRRSLYPAELQARMKFGRANASPPEVRRAECFAEQNLDAGGIHFPRADKKMGPQAGVPVWERGRSILLSYRRIWSGNPHCQIPNHCNPTSRICQRRQGEMERISADFLHKPVAWGKVIRYNKWSSLLEYCMISD